MQVSVESGSFAAARCVFLVLKAVSDCGTWILGRDAESEAEPLMWRALSVESDAAF